MENVAYKWTVYLIFEFPSEDVDQNDDGSVYGSITEEAKTALERSERCGRGVIDPLCSQRLRTVCGNDQQIQVVGFWRR